MASTNTGNNGQFVSSMHLQSSSGHVSSSEYSDMISPQYTPSSSQASGYGNSATPGHTVRAADSASSTAQTPVHSTLTRQYLRAHDAQQTTRRERAHARAAHHQHGRRHATTDNANANADMTPTERFEAASGYPYQQHSNYQPLASDSVHYQQVDTSQYPITEPRDSYTPSSTFVAHTGVNSTYRYPAGVDNQDTTYWTQTILSGKDITDWGYDLAGVGRQFKYEDQA